MRSGYVKDIWGHPQEPKAVLTLFHIPAHEGLTPHGIQKANAQVRAPGADPSVDRYSRLGAQKKWPLHCPSGMPYCQGCRIAFEAQ